MRNAATYSRFSTDRQTESSITDQQRACTEYAERHGLTIVEHHVDEGISGAAVGNRPALAALERAVLDRRVEVVLVADLSRLSRSQSDLPRIIERWRFRGVRTVGVLDGFDSTSRSARMQAGLSGLMSDELRAGIRDRVHLALESRAKRAEPTGSRLYGFTSKREPIDAEVAVVREIFARIAGGETYAAVCASLNVRGVPSPGAKWARTSRRTDGRWLSTTLHELLTNEGYVGRLIWNRSQWVKDPDTGKRQRRERPRAEWVVHERPELAVVDRATWDRVAARLAARSGTAGKGKARPKYLLSGLLECAACGGAFTVAGSRGGTYYCARHRTAPDLCGVALGARREPTERLVLPTLYGALLSDEAVERGLGLMRRALAAPKVAPEASAEVARLAAQAARLRAMVAAGELDEALAAPMLERITAAQDAAGRTRAVAVLGPRGQLERAYRLTVASLRERLTDADIGTAREAIRALVGRIRLADEGGALVAHFGPCTLGGSGGLLWVDVPPVRLRA